MHTAPPKGVTEICTNDVMELSIRCMEQANDDCDELRLDFEECKRVTAEIEKSKGI
jgi:hypothetical protein